MTLNWRYISHGNVETFDGKYTSTNSTVWMHSLIAQPRWDACYFNDGKPQHLGSYPTGNEAIDACEQHAEQQ